MIMSVNDLVVKQFILNVECLHQMEDIMYHVYNQEKHINFT